MQQQQYSSLAHELIAQVESTAQAIIEKELERRGIESGAIAQQAAMAVGEHLVTAWGGQQIYFPKDIARRNARMYDEFKGDNAPELASKYSLSTAAVYQIIASERERRRMKQCSLLDFVPSNGHIAGEVRHG